MSGMAVLVTNEFPPPGYGGIERYMLRLATEIAAAGHDLVVVAPQMPGDASFDAQLPFRVLRFPFRAGSDGIPTLIARMARATARAHATGKHSCTIAASWIRSGIACSLLPRVVRGRLAIMAHGSEVLSQRNPMKKSLMRATFSRADVVVANSMFTAGILGDAGIRKEPVIARCGVEARAYERCPAATPTILSVGRLVRRKGFDRTIEAVALLRDRFPDLRYEIAGSGPDEQYLRDRIAQLSLERNVALLGAISDDGLRDAYARAWCFCLPTRRVGGDVEGFGIVYLEAAMAGLPAVGGIHSGAQEAIEDGRSGVLVDGDDPSAIARALHGFLSDPERAAEMGYYARTRALEQFTWRAAAESIMTALEQRPKQAECFAP